MKLIETVKPEFRARTIERATALIRLGKAEGTAQALRLAIDALPIEALTEVSGADCEQERERARCVRAAMPRRTDEELEQILANPQAEFMIRAAAADEQRDRRNRR